MAHLDFKSFEPGELERAQREDRPILLVITVPRCIHSKELEKSVLADPEVVELVSSSFVPILVDAERRPDVNQRFGAGGWPTLAYLTPSGELIANDGFLTPEQLIGRLERVLEYY